jgi:hypothetical protein
MTTEEALTEACKNMDTLSKELRLTQVKAQMWSKHAHELQVKVDALEKQNRALRLELAREKAKGREVAVGYSSR